MRPRRWSTCATCREGLFSLFVRAAEQGGVDGWLGGFGVCIGGRIVGMAEERLVLVLVFHSPSMPLIRGNSHSPRGLSGLRRVGYCSRAR